MVHFYRPNNPRHGCGRWLGVTDLAHEKEACLFSHDALIHVSYTTMYIAYAAAAYQHKVEICFKASSRLPYYDDNHNANRLSPNQL